MWNRRRWLLGVVLALSAVSLRQAEIKHKHPRISPRFAYTVLDVGPLDAKSSSGCDINDAGQVCGTAYDVTALVDTDESMSRPHAFLWQNGTTIDIPLPKGDSVAYPRAISESGDIVGYSTHFGGMGHPFVFSHGVTARLPLGQAYEGIATCAATDGRVGGLVLSNQIGGGTHSAVWEPGQPKPYQPVEESESRVLAFTPQGGEVVVTDRDIDDDRIDYLSSSGRCDTGYVIRGQALRANRHGLIVGAMSARRGVRFHAFLATKGRATDLETPKGEDSVALGINDAGTVVGSSGVDTWSTRACVWRGGRMRDLNRMIPRASGWDLSEARDINNRGEIVGTGYYRGAHRAFLLRPTGPDS